MSIAATIRAGARQSLVLSPLTFPQGIRVGLAAALLLPPALLAQQPRSIQGQVRDPLGALVANASVDLLDRTHPVAHTTTGPDGSFQLTLPHPGRYSLRVASPSFQTTLTPSAYFATSAQPELSVTLSTPTLTQQVTVTATAVAVPEAQIGASITVLPAIDSRFTPQVQDDLRLVPGLQVTQAGQLGGATGLNIRGGSTDANKVLLDGVPANSIGGAVNFANLASIGITSIEVLREPNSALYGSDALAGVVNLTTARATTPLPLFTYAGDAGSFHSLSNTVTAGAILRQFDLFSAFGRLNTSNNLPNSEFHNATYAGNFGWTPNSANELRFILRHVDVTDGQPNAIALYGIPDDSQQKQQDSYYSALWNNQTTPRWHNQLRYGGLRQNGQSNNFGPVGLPDGFGDTLGAPVTLTGANGYTVHGQALFYYGGSTPYSYLGQTKRDFVYAQSDVRINSHLLALGAFKYEAERGLSGDLGNTLSTIQRGNYSYTLQLNGDLKRRLFYNLGTGLEDNGLFGFAATPRASLAYYLVRPSTSGLFTGTKLHGSFGKGIKEPNLYQQAASLYAVLALESNGPQAIAQYHVSPLGPEDARTYDGGLDQQLLHGRARLGLTYFHNQFTNAVEYVSQDALATLGVPLTIRNLFPYGAYINSSAFRSQGIEFEFDLRLTSHLSARGGYTYTDAVVQHSFNSDNLGCTPPTVSTGCAYNTSFNFSTLPIGEYSPLVGARPFRIAPHTGFFAVTYAASKLSATLTGSLVGKRDDSTYLTDSNFGNSLLLPNRNLLGSYQRFDLGLNYALTHRVDLYANLQNLLSEHYFEAFGYPSMPLTFRAGVKLNFGGTSWKLN
jgi:vitamin B12 transporter